MNINEIIKGELLKSPKVEITYKNGTSQTNGEWIDAYIGGEKVLSSSITTILRRKINTLIEEAISSLQEEFPNLHAVTRKKEFHFLYSGFNSCSTEVVPIYLTTLEEKQKTGIVTERYSQTGANTAWRVIKAYPDYEIYIRRGFQFRGAKESKLERTGDWEEVLNRAFNNSACCDVEVQDDEIHINTFSFNDMW